MGGCDPSGLCERPARVRRAVRTQTRDNMPAAPAGQRRLHSPGRRRGRRRPRHRRYGSGTRRSGATRDADASPARRRLSPSALSSSAGAGPPWWRSGTAKLRYYATIAAGRFVPRLACGIESPVRPQHPRNRTPPPAGGISAMGQQETSRPRSYVREIQSRAANGTCRMSSRGNSRPQ